jgi:hypothetical protein
MLAGNVKNIGALVAVVTKARGLGRSPKKFEK